MSTTSFLNKNFKPLMVFYYKKKYKQDILKMLGFFYDYKNIDGINMFEAIKIMTLDKDNWSLEKATKVFGICVYCGFLGYATK